MPKSAQKCELIVADVKAALKMFDVLNIAAAVEGVEQVEIHFKCGGEADTIVIGYGENAEASIIGVIPWEAS